MKIVYQSSGDFNRVFLQVFSFFLVRFVVIHFLDKDYLLYTLVKDLLWDQHKFLEKSIVSH